MYGVMVPHSKVSIQPETVVKKSPPPEEINTTVDPPAVTTTTANPRDSLELDDSLGILTPEEMLTMDLCLERNSSSTNLGTDHSLGIINEQILAGIHLFDDKTPSPEEELPLDPKPSPAVVDNNSTNSKSATISCGNEFATSITSITSLENGYQGDGEMSRPASRGAPAETSPLGRRPPAAIILALPPQVRLRPLIDPDSDFYTESDHDENLSTRGGGDRNARIIDGTLYGVDVIMGRDTTASAATSTTTASSREPLYSSGVFTDVDSTTASITIGSVAHLEAEEYPASSTITPTETSSSSRTLAIDEGVLPPAVVPQPETYNHRNETKLEKPSCRTSMKRQTFKDVKSRVYISPKIEPSANPQTGDVTVKKISITKKELVINENQQKCINNSANASKSRRFRPRTAPPKRISEVTQYKIDSSLSDVSITASQKQGTSKKRNNGVHVTQVLTASKLSVTKTSQQFLHHQEKTIGSNNSIKGAPAPSKVKKFKSADTLPPPPPLSTTVKPVVVGNSNNNTIDNHKHRKQSSIVVKTASDSGKGVFNSKGACRTTSPGDVRPSNNTALSPQTKPTPKITEALAVLVQHLVFNVDAYQVPTLRRQLLKLQTDADRIKAMYQQLDTNLQEERTKHTTIVEDLQNQLAEAQHCHNAKLTNLTKEFDRLENIHADTVEILREENDAIREEIDDKNLMIRRLQTELHTVQLDCSAQIAHFKQMAHVSADNAKLCKQEVVRLSNELHELKLNSSCSHSNEEETEESVSSSSASSCSNQEVESLRAVLELKQDEVAELRRTLAKTEQKNEVYAKTEVKAAALNARCEDLQLQLERKAEYELSLLADNKKLNESLKEELNRKQRLIQYNEELQWKLKQNKEILTKILEQQDAVTMNNNTNRSYTSYYCCSGGSGNFASGELSRRAQSFREKSTSSFHRTDVLSTSTPEPIKVKGIVEKSDSVSYVLDLDDVPDVIASRIVRRSFRNSTTSTAKSTPTKSPLANKRSRTPLTLSASASAIVAGQRSTAIAATSSSASPSPTNSGAGGKTSSKRTRSFRTRTPPNYCSSPNCFEQHVVDLDEQNEVDDLKLPNLPLTRNGSTVSESVGDANIYSASNSDDDDTSSTSSSSI